MTAKLIQAHLVNGSFGDPLVYGSLAYLGRAFTFDMGMSFNLANRELQRIDTVYVSHAHMDHVCGFDHFLRANVKQDRTIKIFGPAGIHQNIHGKLQGYTWNLTQKYKLVFEVAEIRDRSLTWYRMKSREKFAMRKLSRQPLQTPTPLIHKTDYFTVRTVRLDHRIPSQAYAVMENVAVSIKADVLAERGWLAGPWLQTLKNYAIKAKGDNQWLQVPLTDKRRKKMRVGALKEALILPRKRNSIAYVTDCSLNNVNRRKILALAQGVDIFFCEATFLEADRDKALETYHMTAQHVGALAKQAGVERLVLFHFSKKYLHDPKPLIEEASTAFGKEVEVDTVYRTTPPAGEITDD